MTKNIALPGSSVRKKRIDDPLKIKPKELFETKTVYESETYFPLHKIGLGRKSCQVYIIKIEKGDI